MKRHLGLSITLTIIIVLTAVYVGVVGDGYRHGAFRPFAIRARNANTAVITPLPGIALPEGLRAGDRLNLHEQPLAARILIVRGRRLESLRTGQVAHFVVERGPARISVPIRTISYSHISGALQPLIWMGRTGTLVIALLGLALVWRGRNRAAAGLGLFAIASLLAMTLMSIPLQGFAALAGYFGVSLFSLLMRIGLFIMAESMVGVALSPRARRRWRAGFLVVLGANVMVFVGPLVYVATGWGWTLFLPKPYDLILTVGFLVSVLLLFVGYHRARGTDRARLRWMLWGGGLTAVAILESDVAVKELVLMIAGRTASLLALGAFLYAILRHRVIDIKVVISRTLVYAMTTSLVLGLFALFESLVERTALGHRTSLALELAVPLGLGVSLSTVHRRIDVLVDQFIFRRQYRQEMALRGFAKESAFVSQPETLLDLVVEQIVAHIGAPWVAFYEYRAEGYQRMRQRGEKDLPQTLAIDDLALVKLRAHASDVDLHEVDSSLGHEGYVFPLRAREHLCAALVIGPRPDEHYAAEERELIAHVTHAVGVSLFALRARATEEQLSAARSEVEASAARLNAERADSTAKLEQCRVQNRVNDALLSDLRARESLLLDALRSLGADPRVPTER